ncbi:MAG: hypothetical protein ACJ76S_07285 [Solirubrobacteraceae bacterium]
MDGVGESVWLVGAIVLDPELECLGRDALGARDIAEHPGDVAEHG